MPTDSTALQEAADAALAKLPDNTGVILITVPMDQQDPLVRYASNVGREDAVGMLKTLLFRWGINEEWMKHTK